MYKCEKFYVGVTVQDICDWANERSVVLVHFQFDEHGYCDVIYIDANARI